MVAIIVMYVIMITLKTHVSNKSKKIKAKSLDKMLEV